MPSGVKSEMKASEAGGIAPTTTALLTWPPFPEAVIIALPGATAVTEIVTEVCPAANGAVGGTTATWLSELESASAPAAAGVGLNETVSVPVAPATSTMRSGCSDRNAHGLV